METQILSELLKYGGLVGVLGYGLYIMWKRYDKYTERTQAELTALRDEVKRYMYEDKVRLENAMNQMQHVIEANTHAFDKMVDVANKSNEIMACLMPELVKFKRSKVYKEYQKEGHE